MQLARVPVQRASVLGGLLVTHLHNKRQGTVCFIANASLLLTGDAFCNSLPDTATADEVFQSIQAILSEHPIEAERVFLGVVRPHGHTKPKLLDNENKVVSFIFQASGFTASQSTFLKQELLLKHMGMLPVKIPDERGSMTFTLFNERPADAAVMFKISTRLSAETVSSVLSDILGMKPFFVVAIDHSKAGKMGNTAGDHQPSSLGLAAKNLSPNTTHVALVSALDAKAYSLLKERKQGFKLEVEGEDPDWAPVMHVNRVYPVVPRPKYEGTGKRSRTDTYATGAWGQQKAPLPNVEKIDTPLSAGRASDREVDSTLPPAQKSVVNPSFPSADPQVLDTQQRTDPEAPSHVGEVSTVVGARKATGGSEGDVSMNDRSPEEETTEVALSGQKRGREDTPKAPPQDPTISLKVDCQRLRTLLEGLKTATVRQEDEIGRVSRQLQSSLKELIDALDTQIQVLKSERNAITALPNRGASKAQKEANLTKAKHLLERKDAYEDLVKTAKAELAQLMVEAEEQATVQARAVAEAAHAMDDEDEYGADNHLDAEVVSSDVQEMVDGISSEGLESDVSDEAMADTYGSNFGIDGHRKSSRLASKKAALDLTKDAKVEKPPTNKKCKVKGKKLEAMQTISEEKEEAAVEGGAAIAHQE